MPENNMRKIIIFQISFLRKIVWLMSNLCRNKDPRPPFDKVQIILPALARLLRHDDTEMLSELSKFEETASKSNDTNIFLFHLQVISHGLLVMQQMVTMMQANVLMLSLKLVVSQASFNSSIEQKMT